MPKLTKKVSSPATPAKKAVDKEKLALLQAEHKQTATSAGLCSDGLAVSPKWPLHEEPKSLQPLRAFGSK